MVEEGGDAPRFRKFERDRCILFVDAWHRPPGASDDLAHAFQAAGAPITRPIEHTVYSMREFEVTDPDGGILCFCEEVGSAVSS